MKKSMKILIIVLLLIIVGLVTFIITDAIIENSRKESDETIVIENKSGNNSSKQEDVNTTKNTVQNTTAEKNEVSNTNQTAENSKTDTNTTNNKSNAVEAIKTALKDDKWVIENIMMKKSVFDTELEGEQKLTFMILKKDNNGNPMIAIYAEQDLSSEMFLVSYQNGKVTSNSVTGLPIHNGHGGISIDPNNHIAVWGWGHMGTFSNTYYDIKTGKSVTLDKIGYELDQTEETTEENMNYFKDTENTEISESEYNQINSKYDGYKFYPVDTELTDENVDKYIS